MSNFTQKNIIFVSCLFFVASVFGLWSWNTIAELFSLPEAQYKHALAAFFLVALLRLGLFAPDHRVVNRLFGEKCVHPDH
ncbi:MAG: hypothetical protein HN764_13540 [Gammaproteobacteria bacterium]|nr:hypothetical protein [Gammaproteobacteria bacterium]